MEVIEIKVPKCPYCGSHNVYGLSRIVGYFSKINNWNEGKLGELTDRQKGDYHLNDEKINEPE